MQSRFLDCLGLCLVTNEQQDVPSNMLSWFETEEPGRSAVLLELLLSLALH